MADTVDFMVGDRVVLVEMPLMDSRHVVGETYTILYKRESKMGLGRYVYSVMDAPAWYIHARCLVKADTYVKGWEIP